MKQSDYARFKNTFESAHGRQSPSPFSGLLSGQINFQSISDCLDGWHEYSKNSHSLLDQLQQYLESTVDPEIIEDNEKIPQEYLQSLRELGCLRARIPEEYGGLNISQCEFTQLLERLGSYSEVLALVVSVQQLGVAQGLLSLRKLETSENHLQSEQLRRKYLRKLADKSIGAFCLTTPETGSDPSRLQTLAKVNKANTGYELSGDWKIGGKLYTTLGTIADVYIMLAVVVYPGESISDIEPRKRITAFIVEREFPGISVKPLQFCGWHGLPNAAIKLDKVYVPFENRVGEVGEGLKIAFMNLGSGRINIAAISLGMMKQLQCISRWWGGARVQGGKPIAEHELNSDQLVKMNAWIYASESYLQFVSALADQKHRDIRLEAAILKLFTSHALVEIADETLQLRGGRGYETYASQHSRGEYAVAVERLFRSARMMKIGEGGSNILQLYMMRCLLDNILKDYKKLTNPNLTLGSKFLSLSQATANFVKCFFVPLILSETPIPKSLKEHFRYLKQANRRFKRIMIAKISFGYLHYAFLSCRNFVMRRSSQAIPSPEQAFEERQILLGQCAQIAMLLSVMSVCCLRAAKAKNTQEIALANEFCIRVRGMIKNHETIIADHTSKRENTINNLTQSILKGEYADLVENNIVANDFPDIQD